MPTNCPHCDGDIQTAIDPVIKQRLKTQQKKLQSEHTTRLEGQQREIELLERRAGELATAAASVEGLQAELQGLRATVQQAERVEVLRSTGLATELLGDIQTLYDSRQAGKPEGERSSFADFLGPDGEARGMVLLAHHFAAGQPAEQPPGAPAVAPSRAQALPNGNGGAIGQTPRAARLSVAQVQEYLASPAFRQLPMADQRSKLAELKGQVAAESRGTGIP
jgi:hypothetical protein